MQLFIIYARENTKEKEKLLTTIENSVSNRDIEIWHDKKIPIGENWETVILENLSKSAVFIFIISEHFFSSSFIQSVEFKEACKRHSEGESLIIPFLASPSNWETNQYIKKIQAFPRDGIPFTSQKNKQQIMEEFARELNDAIKRFKVKMQLLEQKRTEDLLAEARKKTEDYKNWKRRQEAEAEERKSWRGKLKYFWEEDLLFYFVSVVKWLYEAAPIIILILIVVVIIIKCS
jgi:hypothetical protein